MPAQEGIDDGGVLGGGHLEVEAGALVEAHRLATNKRRGARQLRHGNAFPHACWRRVAGDRYPDYGEYTAEPAALTVYPGSARSASASAVAEEDAARRAALKQVRGLRGLEYRDFRNRLAGYLQRRGFGYDVIRPIVDELWRAQGTSAPDEATWDD